MVLKLRAAGQGNFTSEIQADFLQLFHWGTLLPTDKESNRKERLLTTSEIGVKRDLHTSILFIDSRD